MIEIWGKCDRFVNTSSNAKNKKKQPVKKSWLSKKIILYYILLKRLILSSVGGCVENQFRPSAKGFEI